MVHRLVVRRAVISYQVVGSQEDKDNHGENLEGKPPERDVDAQ
jgi:hypothetical protein